MWCDGRLAVNIIMLQDVVFIYLSLPCILWCLNSPTYVRSSSQWWQCPTPPLLCALQIIHINVRRRQNVSCAEKVETYIYHFSMDPDTSPLEKKRTIANVSYVPWIIPSRCLLTVIMDSTVPIAFLVKWFWRRVIVVMDVLVCVWRLAVPVRILVNAVIGAR